MRFVLKHLKLIIWAIIGIIIVSIVVYMTSSVNSELERITDAYLSLTGNTNVSGKKDNFYSEYIEQQEENQEAIASGDSTAGTSTVVGSSTGSGSHSYSGSGTAYGYATEAEANSAIAAKAAEIGIAASSFEVREVNGRYYVRELQSSTYWDKILDENGNIMSTSGCMWFATAAALSAKTGEIYTVSELLTAVGYNVTIGSNKYYIWDDNGSSVKLPFIGRYLSKTYIDGITQLSPAGLVTTGTNGTISVSGVSTVDRDALNNGTIYIVHASHDTQALVSSGKGSNPQHFFVLVGYDSSSNVYYIVNPSGAAKSTNTADADAVDRLLDSAYAL